MKTLTIKQASTEFDIPISRIRNAIKKGWLKSEIVKGRHEFNRLEFLQSLEAFVVPVQKGKLTIDISVYRNLKFSSRDDIRLSTGEAVSEYMELYKRGKLTRTRITPPCPDIQSTQPILI